MLDIPICTTEWSFEAVDKLQASHSPEEFISWLKTRIEAGWQLPPASTCFDDQALALLQQMTNSCPKARLTASQVLAHPFFEQHS
jgi:hypothetical protein